MPLRDQHTERSIAHCHKDGAREYVKQVQIIAAAAATSRYPVALRTEKTERPGHRAHSGGRRDRTKSRNIVLRNLIYKSKWPQ
jgi:hypothetical protein